ncbi:hypothetical protein GCM10027615_54610 [Plantactinospora veratri]
MTRWTPDPTFYASPRDAAEAPPEKLAYVAAFDRTARRPDAIAVVDVDPDSPATARWWAGRTCPTPVTSCTTSAGTRAAARSARPHRTRTSSAAT